jgi:PAS domain S-box-containing protein
MDRLKRTVLLIDEIHDRAQIYAHWLSTDTTFTYQLIEDAGNPQLPTVCQTVQVDGILLDSGLANIDCLELLSRFQLQLGETCPPVIVIGNEDVRAAVQALKTGAADYLVKDQLTAESLCLSLRTAIENAELKRKLHQSQERFRTSIENMMDCFGIYSAIRGEAGQIIDFRIDYVNAAACENNHMTREQQLGRGLCEVLPGHRESGLFEAYCRLVETGEPVIKDAVLYDDTYAGEKRLVRAFDIRASQLNDGFVASWRDVTDRLQTEHQLQQQMQEAETGRQTLEALMQYLPEGITIADAPDGVIRWVSRYGQQLTGRAAEDLEGVAIADYANTWDLWCADGVTPAANAALPLTRAIRTGEVIVDEEWVLRRPDGQKLCIACNAGPIYNADGQITGGIIAWRDISHRKQLETTLSQTALSLQQKQHSLLQLIEQAPIGIGIGAANGDVMLINDVMLQLHGYTREEFEQHGMNWWDFVPPEGRAQSVQGMEQLQRHGVIPPEEKELVRRDGTRIPILISAAQWIEAFDKHITFAVDLTSQKAAEAALQAGKQNLRRVLDTLFSFVGILTPEGILIEANQTALAAASLDPADVIGQPFDQTYWWAYSTEVQAQLRDAIARAAAGETVRYDVSVRLASDQFVTIDFALVPLLDDIGQIEYLIPSGIDVSERLAVEASLRESHEQLQQQLAEIEVIYQTAPIGLNVLDRNFRFVRINERLAEVNGLPVEAHLGRTVRELLPNLADAAEALLSPIFATGEPILNVEIEGETPARPGVKRVWRESFIPLKDGDEVIGISTVCEEITESRQAEQEREQLLQRECEAREAAERASRIKDEFLAIVSHELRSPLNPILGWAQLLQTRQLSPEKMTQALATIARNAQLQAKLIDDLLDVARILRGKLTLKRTAINLVPIVRAALETVHTVAEEKSITLHTDLPDVAQIRGDAMRLEQIIWNLLTNAIKFTPEHGQVDLHLSQQDGVAQLVVADTGIGIHPDFLPYIFESFRQKDASVTRQFGGLGLGLAIVRHLVEAHGGTITADSPGEGQGAVFTVTLPLLAQAAKKTATAYPETAQPDLTGIRIILIDDHRDSLDLLELSLKGYGAVVQSFTSATAALASLTSTLPDIIISDIGMPEMDGYTFIQRLRALPPDQGGQIPAIAVTAYVHEEDRQRVLASGFQQHIPKPIEIGRVAKAVLALTQPAEATPPEPTNS